MDYTTLSLAEVRTGLDAMAQETQATFGGFDARQLNWRADAARWSVAQCFEHLLTTNRLMFRAAEDALNDARPRTLWQRLPVLPGVLGRMLIRSQAPSAARRFTAPSKAQPASDAGRARLIRCDDERRSSVAAARRKAKRYGRRWRHGRSGDPEHDIALIRTWGPATAIVKDRA